MPMSLANAPILVRQLRHHISEKTQTGYRASTGFLTNQVFPPVVKYATHPYVIFATMLLLIPLILDSSNTNLALVLGNYTNVVSASVSSIVLFQSLVHQRENKKLHAQHAKDIALLHSKLDALSQQMPTPTPSPSLVQPLAPAPDTHTSPATPTRRTVAATPQRPTRKTSPQTAKKTKTTTQKGSNNA